jgi:predicted AAA+ superfamily ATPase
MFTFEEYLRAIGEEALCGIVAEHVRTFQLTGGMPAVVASYVQRRDLIACFKLLDDFAKYGKRVPVARLSEVFRSVVLQSGGKFQYSRITSETSAPALKSALTLLVQAGLVHRVVHTHARGLPLGAQADDKKFKAILFDIVPVEVKAATRGGMQSMRRFLDERGLSKGIRVSLDRTPVCHPAPALN